MRDTRLIFIEGLTGSGKSITAQWLCHLLDAHGVPATWYHELDRQHPVYRYNEVEQAAREAAPACEAFHAQARAAWRQIVEDASRDRLVRIFESSFFQAPIFSMQLAMCDRGAITRHVDETARIVSPLKPVLIVLRHTDTAGAFTRICERRGSGYEEYLLQGVRRTSFGRARDVHGRDGLVELLIEQAALARELTHERAMDTLEIEIGAGDWNHHRSGIARFLGVAHNEPRPSVDVSGLTGRYLDTESKSEMVVGSDGRGLFLHPSGTRLLPRAADTFDVEGLSVELTFERIDGLAERILCAARVTDFGPVWVRQHDSR